MLEEVSFKKGLNFVIAIPILNAIATSTVNYFPETLFHPGILRATAVGLFIVWFIISGKYPNEKTSLYILLYLAFMFGLALFSSNLSKTMNDYLKIVLSMAMYPIGYYYFKTMDAFKKLNYIYFWVLVMFITDIIIANVFSLGSSDYLADSFYFGAARVNITKAMILLVFIAPINFLLVTPKHRKTLALIYVVGLLVALIGIKRTVLLSAITGFIIYLMFSPHRTKILKGSIILIILIVTVFSYFLDVFFQRFQARENRIQLTEENLEEEARYNELELVMNAWVEGSVKHKLIGSEFLNDRAYYGTIRMLHIDYMIVLSGSGLIGIYMWFFVYFSIIKSKNKYYKYLRSDKFFQELNAVFWMLLIAQLLLSISGTIYSINIRSLLFLYWGAIVGLMRSEAYLKYNENTYNSSKTTLLKKMDNGNGFKSMV